jgi:hypothetical protein
MDPLTLTFLALTCASLAGEHTYAGVCKYKLYSAFGLWILGIKIGKIKQIKTFCFENGTRYGKGRCPGMVTWFVSWNRFSISGVRKIFL